ncbi:hypothetical protein [Polyangium spumosum]|uniref:SPOR domain-containing protein n=1 Tax=Polyangium spumosum TaxID=889282 RepID=A0A6N7PND9_9BACT|nr:hypothetical protein [Polyangium spumosum]MRG90411.1 hypothetical protein [Polyangium spumosum]
MRTSRLGAAAFSLVLLAAGTVLTACPAKETPAPVHEAKPGRLEVSTTGATGVTAGEPTSTAGSAPAPAPAEGAKAVRIEVKKGGDVLGFVRVTPGAPGKLELSNDSDAAKALEALWNKEKCSESVAVPAERATKEGGFEHDTRVVRSTSPEYGSAVRGFLLGRGYDVRALEAPAVGP